MDNNKVLTPSINTSLEFTHEEVLRDYEIAYRSRNYI